MTRMGDRQPPATAVIQKETDALLLRRAGITYDVIAERLGYAHRSSARKAVNRALVRTQQDPADETRRLEVDRLDAIQAAHWREALNGNIASTAQILRVMERRARLLGLDAPTAVAADVTATGTVVVNFGIPRPTEPDPADILDLGATDA